MSLPREEVLRELELLPVWRLRVPQKTVLQVTPTIPAATMSSLPETILPVETLPVISSADILPEVVQQPAPELLAVLSDNHHYLFMLEPNLSADAEALLDNMLQAIAVKAETKTVGVASKLLSECEPKLLIAMGEVAAHALLAEPAPLEQLRAKVHRISGFTANELMLIVTYSPTHLLDHPANKSSAWQDLCLAMATLQALSTQS